MKITPSVFLALMTLSLMGCVQTDPYAFYNGRYNFLNQNYEIARVQLIGPAEAGDPEAQYALGYMYLNGLGTPADEQEALRWITLSAKNGYPKAQRALHAITPDIEAMETFDDYAEPYVLPKTPAYRKKLKKAKVLYRQKRPRIITIKSISKTH